MDEPAVKRNKLDLPHNFTVEVVLKDDPKDMIPLSTVCAGQIQDKRHLSAIIKELSQKIPLHNLQHLKRVHNSNVIICPREDIGDQKLSSYLSQRGISHAVTETLCKTVIEVKVPAIAPRLRYQYELMNPMWPCKFHPDHYLESVYAGTNFNAKQRAFITRMLNLVIQLSEKAENHKPLGLCIDPRSNSIVAIATSHADINPIMHCPMVLVDNVARTQNSGAWKSQIQYEFNENSEENMTLAGLPNIYQEFINDNPLYKEVTLGAERLKSGDLPSQIVGNCDQNDTTDNLAKYGPYLCTGYEVFLTHEPCLMCAMALIHSRVKRVFFVQHSNRNGALASRYKLHTVRELNHHYEVFCCTLNI